jgi:hypothetical protein
MRDPDLAANVRSQIPLLYADGADAATDRPAHVRAASGLARIDGEIALIQDDASFIAIIDPESGRARAIPLPADADGVRQFHKARSNKQDKLDLEACVVVDSTLLAFGSGSLPKREVVVGLRLDEGPDVRVVHAPALYGALRAQTRFAGSEMNIEAAVVVGDRLRLFSRGNGRTTDTQQAVNASCDVELRPLLAYLEAPDHLPAPTPMNVVVYQLGMLEGVLLGITDATTLGDVVLYSAAAESSPNVVDDGVVVGSAIGIVSATGETRWTPVRQPSGALFPGKVEGILMAGDRVLAVIDMDDPDVPSELCTIELRGF